MTFYDDIIPTPDVHPAYRTESIIRVRLRQRRDGQEDSQKNCS